MKNTSVKRFTYTHRLNSEVVTIFARTQIVANAILNTRTNLSHAYELTELVSLTKFEEVSLQCLLDTAYGAVSEIDYDGGTEQCDFCKSSASWRDNEELVHDDDCIHVVAAKTCVEMGLEVDAYERLFPRAH